MLQNRYDREKDVCKRKEKLTFFTKFEIQTNFVMHSFFGRHIKNNGTLYCSLAYTKLHNNFGECIVQTHDETIVIIETFFSYHNEVFALVRKFEHCVELELDDGTPRFGFLFLISNPSPILKILASSITNVWFSVKTTMRF